MQGMLPAVALHPSKPDSTLCSWAGPAKAALARPGGVDLGKGRACLYQMGSMGSHKARPVPTRPVQQAGAAADWSPHPPLCLHSPGCGGSFWVCMSVAVPCTLCTALACSVILDTPAACMKSVMCMLDKCTGSWFELLMTFAIPPPPPPPLSLTPQARMVQLCMLLMCLLATLSAFARMAASDANRSSMIYVIHAEMTSLCFAVAARWKRCLMTLLRSRWHLGA